MKAKWNANLTEAQLYADRAVDGDFYLDMISAIMKPEMAKGIGYGWNGILLILCNSSNRKGFSK